MPTSNPIPANQYTSSVPTDPWWVFEKTIYHGLSSDEVTKALSEGHHWETLCAAVVCLRDSNVREILSRANFNTATHINQVDRQAGWTLLHHACLHDWDQDRQTSIINSLLGAGANLNCATISPLDPLPKRVKIDIPLGATPLWIAAEKSNVAVVKLLLSLGGKLDQTPLTEAGERTLKWATEEPTAEKEATTT